MEIRPIDIQPIDMTTPLNLEMLKELRATLTELTKQREMDDRYACMTLAEERKQMLQIRNSATQAVMRAITLFCNPMMTAK